MGVTVVHTIGDLVDDLKAIGPRSRRGFAQAVRTSAQQGSRVAKASARKTAGRHGKHYPKSIRPEKRDQFHWQFGPDSSMKQGRMSFEHGSENQPEHLDLAKGADSIAQSFPAAVGDVVDDCFW